MHKHTAAACIALVISTTPAFAGYETQGYFGGRCTPDGAVNLRRTTTEAVTPARGESVAQRPRPDYTPTPISLGSLQLYPALYTGAYVDSNIYASGVNEQSDMVWKVNPILTALTNWGRHALAVTAFGDANIYTDNSNENHTNGALQAEGRFDIAPKTYVAAHAGYQRATEPRSSADNVGGMDRPVRFDVTQAGAEAFRGAGLLSAMVGYLVKTYAYDNTPLVGGGTSLQSLRDRTHNMVKTELAYRVTGNLKPFVRGQYEWRDYDNSGQRNSDGYNVVGGAQLDFGGITFAELYVGYLQRDYKNFAGGRASALDVGGSLLWNLTPLTSISAEVGRSIEETTVGGMAVPTAASSYTATGGSVAVTHELLRNLVVEVSADYTQNNYNNSLRVDDRVGAGAGARYYFNRHLFSDVTYDFDRRDSNVAGADYDRHIMFLRLGAQY